MTIRFLLLSLLLGALTACGAPTTPSTPSPTTLPTLTVGAPSTSVPPTKSPPTESPQLLTVTSAPSVTPAATVIAATALPTTRPEKPTTAAPTAPARSTAASDSTTPLLVFPTDRGLMTVRADGTGKTSIANTTAVVSHDLSDGTTAHGWLAFRSGAGSLDIMGTTAQTVTLNLQQLPTGTLTTITPLFSPAMEQAIRAAQSDRTDAIEAGIAILENSDTLKWSPDGRYLAFIAAIDGPSSDVYSYDRETGKINRLTDGLNQAANLFWSPDSKWIVHEEVESFGTGAGWNVNAVWAAAPDNSNTRKLYDATSSSGGEIFVEWLAPDKFLVYSWTDMGWRDVRVVDLNTGNARLIGPQFEVQTLAYDPETQTQLYFVDDFTAKQHDLSGGLYLAAPRASRPELIAAGDWYETRWLPHAQLFFAQGPAGVISVTPDDIVQEFAGEEALPIESPDGAWLLAWGDGNYTSPIGLRLYATDSELKRTITSDSVAFATWSPDSTGVFYQSDGQLYFVEIPNGEPQLIGESTARELSNIGWVKP